MSEAGIASAGIVLGRVVYRSAAVLVITALRQGRNQGYTVERLKAFFGVTRPTLQRWRRYFREVFPCSHSWKSLSGRTLVSNSIKIDLLVECGHYRPVCPGFSSINRIPGKGFLKARSQNVV